MEGPLHLKISIFNDDALNIKSECIYMCMVGLKHLSRDCRQWMRRLTAHTPPHSIHSQ